MTHDVESLKHRFMCHLSKFPTFIYYHIALRMKFKQVICVAKPKNLDPIQERHGPLASYKT